MSTAHTDGSLAGDALGRGPRVAILAVCAAGLLGSWGLAGCDREAKDERARAAEKKWERHRTEYGEVPEADGAEALDRPYPTVVVEADRTLVRGEALGATPSVMEVVRTVGDGPDASGARTWVVWAVRDVSVERLARMVEALRVADEGATVLLAVEYSPGRETAIGGVQLAPADDPELSASNAFAVHAPGETPVTEFLDQLRGRRGDDEKGLEGLSE